MLPESGPEILGGSVMNYAYWLSNIPGIGNRTIHRLIAQAGNAREVYFLKDKQLEAMGFLKPSDIDRMKESRGGGHERSFESLCARGIAFVSAEDQAYPDRLRQIPDAPYSIYVKGSLPDSRRRAVAIVGARKCSSYGYAAAKELGRQLALHGATVISGMAMGIDQAGHKGALEGGGQTCAVLGCGVDICYPAVGGEIYQEIQGAGGLISEYPPGTQPKPGFFPARNRIISGLCDVLTVVEAKARSGSLITADFALEQGRDVYAVPGRMTDTLSAGCNELIYQGAGIITNIGKFLKELELGPENVDCQLNFIKLLLEKEERLVYSCVDLRPKNMEKLLQETGLPMPEMARVLAELTQKGFITETFKNYYIKRI